jgi:hypothetical protein
MRVQGRTIPVEPGVPQATTVGLDAHLEEALALTDRHRLDLCSRTQTHTCPSMSSVVCRTTRVWVGDQEAGRPKP